MDALGFDNYLEARAGEGGGGLTPNASVLERCANPHAPTHPPTRPPTATAAAHLPGQVQGEREARPGQTHTHRVAHAAAGAGRGGRAIDPAAARPPGCLGAHPSSTPSTHPTLCPPGPPSLRSLSPARCKGVAKVRTRVLPACVSLPSPPRPPKPRAHHHPVTPPPFLPPPHTHTRCARVLPPRLTLSPCIRHSISLPGAPPGCPQCAYCTHQTKCSTRKQEAGGRGADGPRPHASLCGACGGCVGSGALTCFTSLPAALLGRAMCGREREAACARCARPPAPRSSSSPTRHPPLTLPPRPAPPATHARGAGCAAASRTTASGPCSAAWPQRPRPLREGGRG